eukprot:3361114-Pleurochrysis_carterae.AAC.1
MSFSENHEMDARQHLRWTYEDLDETNFVFEIRQKRPVSFFYQRKDSDRPGLPQRNNAHVLSHEEEIEKGQEKLRNVRDICHVAWVTLCPGTCLGHLPGGAKSAETA